MIKRTLYFGNPAYLSLNNKQLVIKLPQIEKSNQLSDTFKKESITSIPIEDIGIVILDEKQITITQSLIASLLDNNVAFITCDDTHLPTGMLLNLCGNHLQNERFREQLDSSLPLKKQLWQQTIEAKITNQAVVLESRKINADRMFIWANEVKSGDAENHEARAAAYYWSTIFKNKFEFKRDRFGEPPNNLLNYGYAILRGVVARSLVASGLLPTLGIHHENKYNAYCLADDIMEPYRPYVDQLVCSIIDKGDDISELTKNLKTQLLNIPTLDIVIDSERSPLMVGMQRTTASLTKCFAGETRKLLYPAMV